MSDAQPDDVKFLNDLSDELFRSSDVTASMLWQQMTRYGPPPGTTTSTGIIPGPRSTHGYNALVDLGFYGSDAQAEYQATRRTNAAAARAPNPAARAPTPAPRAPSPAPSPAPRAPSPAPQAPVLAARAPTTIPFPATGAPSPAPRAPMVAPRAPIVAPRAPIPAPRAPSLRPRAPIFAPRAPGSASRSIQPAVVARPAQNTQHTGTGRRIAAELSGLPVQQTKPTVAKDRPQVYRNGAGLTVIFPSTIAWTDVNGEECHHNCYKDPLSYKFDELEDMRCVACLSFATRYLRCSFCGRVQCKHCFEHVDHHHRSTNPHTRKLEKAEQARKRFRNNEDYGNDTAPPRRRRRHA